jgi:hypothetical protein
MCSKAKKVNIYKFDMIGKDIIAVMKFLRTIFMYLSDRK